MEGLFGKKEIKSLAAVKGKAADEISVEQINAINEEFAEIGFEGIEVAVAGTLSESATQLNTANDTIATHVATIEAKTTELEAANAKVAELTAKLEKKPAAAAAEPAATEDPIKPVGGEEKDTFIEDLSTRIKAERGLI